MNKRANAAIVWKDGAMHVGAIPVGRIIEEYGTPTYVYDAEIIRNRYSALVAAFKKYNPRICYSVKANSNLSILDLLHRCGASFDIVSGGELERLKLLKVDPTRIVFAGCAKTDEELRLAIETGVGIFNVESSSELSRINTLSKTNGKVSNVSLRLNPDLDVKTLPGITTVAKWSKFGISPEEVTELQKVWKNFDGVKIVGLQVHLGSQLSVPETYKSSFEYLVRFARGMREWGFPINSLSVGGGFGVPYFSDDESKFPEFYEFADAVESVSTDFDFELLVEPGRSLVATSGVLLSRVISTKQVGGALGVFVDAAMNDLMRPALYGTPHAILVNAKEDAREIALCNVYGPVCESTDTFGSQVEMPADIAKSDVVAFGNAGAYGFVLSSNYNTRLRAAEIMVDGSNYKIVRSRETIEHVLFDEFKNICKGTK